MSLLAKIENLNSADLSALAKKIDALRKQLSADLQTSGNRTLTAADLQTASAATGLSVEQLLTELQRHQRVS